MRVPYAVVGFVWFHQLREFSVVPVKFPAVHDHAAYLDCMAVQVFGGGMDHDIRAEGKRAAENGGGEGVVHNQRDLVRVSYLGELLNIKNSQRRVGQRLPKDQPGIRPDLRGNLFRRRVGIDKRTLDAQPFEGNAKQVDGPAVDGRGRKKMVAGAADIQNADQGSSLAGGGAQSANPAFQRGNLLFHHFHRGIGNARVHMPFRCQVK